MINKRLQRLLEELGDVAAKPVATENSDGKTLNSKISNDTLYPNDTHMQAEDVEEIIVERSNPFATIDFVEPNLNESDLLLREDVDIGVTKNNVLIKMPTPLFRKNNLISIEEQLLTEALLNISNIFSKKSLTESQIFGQANAYIIVEDREVDIAIYANSPKSVLKLHEAEELQKNLAIIKAVLSEEFKVEEELEKIVSMGENFIELLPEESKYLSESLNSNQLLLLKESLSEYDALVEGKIIDWFRKKAIDFSTKMKTSKAKGDIGVDYSLTRNQENYRNRKFKKAKDEIEMAAAQRKSDIDDAREAKLKNNKNKITARKRNESIANRKFAEQEGEENRLALSKRRSKSAKKAWAKRKAEETWSAISGPAPKNILRSNAAKQRWVDRKADQEKQRKFDLDKVSYGYGAPESKTNEVTAKTDKPRKISVISKDPFKEKSTLRIKKNQPAR